MHSATTLVFYLFVFLTFAHASVIPVRRITDPSIRRKAPSGHLQHRRHARFVKRQQASSVVSTITLVPAKTSSASTSAITSVSPSAVTSASSPTVTSVAPASANSSNATSVAPSSTSVSAILSSSTTGSVSASTSSNSSVTATPTAIPASTNGSTKYVVAHHMIGNTFPYTLQDWTDDITLAQASGIDGFALNTGSDSWQPARIADAYEAAKQSGLNFKLFLSLDMSSLGCASPNDAQNLVNLVKPYIGHPNQLEQDNRAFVSTFSGENCNFGQGSTANGWKTQFVQSPDLQGKVYFVPSFFIDPATFTDFTGVMDGDFNWNSGWPIEVTTSFAQNLIATNASSSSNSNTGVVAAANTASTNGAIAAVAANIKRLQTALSPFIGSTDTDEQHIDALKSLSGGQKTYMAAVSPWFFTHYGQDSFNKNFIFLADQHLYAKRWESLVDSRDQVNIVEIVTWNDYGESHYVGPIKGDQPNSQAWTDGMNHTAWLDLTKYYASAFKTGQYPAIEKDKIIMWSRPHASQAQAADPVGQPTNFELSTDAIWAVVMTTAPSTVTLSTSATSSTSFNVPAGLTKLSVPITPGGTMTGTIARNGTTVLTLAPSPNEFTFQGSPATYNFNAFVTSATAA